MARGSGRTALLTLLGIVGVLALLVGAGLALVFGPQSHLQSKATRMAGPGSAILGEGIEVDASSLPIPSWMGDLTLDVRPVGNGSLFVGTASQSDLDTYLRDSSYDVVTSLHAGGRAEIRSVPGSELPQPPETQTFWLDQSAGAPGGTVSIVSARGSEASLVVMNRTPSNGVAADIVLTLTVGWAWITALALMVVGAVALLIAVWLTVRSRKSRRATGAPEPGPARHAAPAGAAASTILPGLDLPGPASPAPQEPPVPEGPSVTPDSAPVVPVPDAAQGSPPPQ